MFFHERVQNLIYFIRFFSELKSNLFCGKTKANLPPFFVFPENEIRRYNEFFSSDLVMQILNFVN